MADIIPTIVIAGVFEYSEEIKKSRFFARAAPVDSATEAMEFLEKVREPGATHNCWAYKVGGEYRFNDDGEPGGTAGRPILGAIEHRKIDRVMVLVTRYFGGIKLGAGGLARAYGGVASSCLRLAPKRHLVPKIKLRLGLEFEHIGVLHQLMEKYNASQLDETYTETGLVAVVSIDLEDLDRFKKSLADATRGCAEVDISDS